MVGEADRLTEVGQGQSGGRRVQEGASKGGEEVGKGSGTARRRGVEPEDMQGVKEEVDLKEEEPEVEVEVEEEAKEES